MKKYLLLLLLLISIKLVPVQAAVVPANMPESGIIIPKLPAQFATMNVKEIQKLMGRKLTLKERIGVKVLQWKMRKELKRAKPEETSKSGKLAFTFALIALGSLVLMLFFPTLFFLTGLMAFLAMIFGNKGKRENPDDKKAKAAFTIGWILLAVLLLFILAILIAFASTDWRFG